NAFYVEGMRVEDGGVSFTVVGAKKDINGNRKDFGTGYGPDTAFDLPPGDYAALAKMGEAVVETPFAVAAGEATAVEALLAAGVLAVTAPGMDFIEVFGAETDIQGKRKAFGYAYGGALQTTLPEGEYTIVAHTPDRSATKEATATVTAGE